MRFHPSIRDAEQDSASSSSSSSSSSNPRDDTQNLSRWTNSEETGQYLSPVISIQRAWRSYRNTRKTGSVQSLEELNSQSYAGQSERDETSETDSSNGVQMMNLSTPEDNEQNLKIDDDLPSSEDPDCGIESVEQSEADVPDKKAYNVSYSLAMRCGIDSDPESIVSDYSEMADPIKEHLANVQIIQKEDLDLGNTFVDSFLIQPKIFRGSEEDEEQFNKRLRKTNYLSLAQEFAELKKVNASALPFGLHKEKYQTVSPMSDAESGSDLDCSGLGGGSLGDSSEALSTRGNNRVLGSGTADGSEGLNHAESNASRAGNAKKSNELLASESSAGSENADSKTNQFNPVSNPRISSSTTSPNDVTVPRKQEVPDMETSDSSHGNEYQLASSLAAPGARNCISVLPSLESESSHVPDSPGKVKSVRRKMEESLGEFDIYTVETALPQMDWQHLEEQLRKAAEEEQKKWTHCGDREQIRRKLAMPDEDDSFDSDLLLRKPSLQSRLQTNMNLHMCFVNEAAASEAAVARGRMGDLTCFPSSTPDVVPVQSRTEFLKVGSVVSQDDNEDFFAKQARLQAEAKMALAQVRPMAHMQLQLEKQLKKKSPLAEIVGIPGFIDGKFRHLSKHLLLQMNFAQLQVVVNDLHAQIEVLNMELMQQLVDRDDLHMAQDSMLVDIEDLTGRAQEFAARVNKRAEKREFLK